MLPKEQRLSKTSDINKVMSKGFWIKGALFSARVLDLVKNQEIFNKNNQINNPERELKIAVSVGVKYSKKAVERNRLRRQVFEVVGKLFTGGVIKSGYYILIVPNFNLSKIKIEKSFAEISEEIKLLLNKV